MIAVTGLLMSDLEAFGPLSLSPIFMVDTKYDPAADTSIPIMKFRRETAGDEVNVFGFNPDDSRQYRIIEGGAYVTDEDLLYPSESFFAVNKMDQTIGGNDAVQVTGAKQPGVVWEPATFGPDDTVNGGFNTDTAWNKSGIWTISGGTANIDGSQVGSTNLSQPGLTVDKVYEATFTVKNYSTGLVRLQAGANGFGTNRTANGTYTEIIRAKGSGVIIVQANIDFVGSVDDVSMREVLTSHGSPKIEYDAVDDSLDLTGLTHAASDYTIFARVQSPSTAGTDIYLFSTQTGPLSTAYPALANTAGYSDGTFKTAALSSLDMLNLTVVLEAAASGAIYNGVTLLGNGLAYTQKAIGGSVAIGSLYNGTSNLFNGKYESLIIWDRILTFSEIRDLYYYYQ